MKNWSRNVERKAGDKRYGDEPTDLNLTELAEFVYNEIQPLSIIERADGTYAFTGGIEWDGVEDADEVIETLEQIAGEGECERAGDIVEAGLYDAAVALMDDEIREEIHGWEENASKQMFLTEYMLRHMVKYGTRFQVN